MKKHIIKGFVVMGAVTVIALSAIGLQGCKIQIEKDFLRLHIRANSNSAADQDVKYLVKQQVVNELTPMFVGIVSKGEAMDMLAENLPLIEQTANTVLQEQGFDYAARVALKSEHFPTRAYSGPRNVEVVLPEGLYDALVIELGEGMGDNWWCVVYPPLCFLENNIGGDQGVKYRSKLHEIIKRVM